MIHQIILPMLGETMDEGQVTAWRKAEGDKVTKGEPLFEVTTDKAAFEAESPASGYLRKILCPASEESIPVAKVIGYISDKPDEPLPSALQGLAVQAKPKAKAAQIPEVAPVVAATSSDAEDTGKIKISPLARKLARQQGLDLEQLRGKGTGPGGRIVKQDILESAKSPPVVKAPPAAEPAAASGQTRSIPMSRMRQAIGRRLSQSKQTIPHYYLTTVAKVDELLELRKDVITDIKNVTGVRVTYTDLIIKAVGLALMDCPAVNATLVDGHIQLASQANVGFAVAVPDGLLVPVIKAANSKPLSKITGERAEFVNKARSGKLTPADMSGGTFTISNLGTLPVDHFAAIINPPEVAILAVGRMIRAAVVDANDKVVAASVMHMTLSADHRVVDGAVGAEFLGRLVEIIEGPYQLLRNGI